MKKILIVEAKSKFTIQNVPIKQNFVRIFEAGLSYLQYKMFLLNKEKYLFENIKL